MKNSLIKIILSLPITNSLVKLYSAHKGYGFNEIFKKEIGQMLFLNLHEGDFGDLILIKK